MSRSSPPNQEYPISAATEDGVGDGGTAVALRIINVWAMAGDGNGIMVDTQNAAVRCRK